MSTPPVNSSGSIPAGAIELEGVVLPIFQADAVKMGHRLGEGNFAEVFAATVNTQHYVIKLLKTPGTSNKLSEEELLKQNKRTVENFKHEARMMQQLTNERMVSIIGQAVLAGRNGMVIERMDGMLSDIAFGPAVQLSADQTMTLLLDIAQGILWLHKASVPVLHQDIKMDNVLYTYSEGVYRAKIADLGLAIQLLPDMSGKRPSGSPLYMSPEALLFNVKGNVPPGMQAQFHLGTDVYAFSFLAFELLMRHRVNIARTREQLFKCVIYENRRPVFSSRVEQEFAPLVELIRKCWLPLPKDRPTMAQVVDQLAKLARPQQVACEHFELMWKDLFQHVTSVSVDQFVKKVRTYMFETHRQLAESYAPQFSNVMNNLAREYSRGGRLEKKDLVELVRHIGPVQHLGTWKAFFDEVRVLFDGNLLYPFCRTDVEVARLIGNMPDNAYFVCYSSKDPKASKIVYRQPGQPFRQVRITRSSEGLFVLDDDKSTHARLSIAAGSFAEKHNLILCKEYVQQIAYLVE